jgi:ATP-dependent RNA helicase RhlE
MVQCRFSRTKIGAERFVRKLAAAGIRCAWLHADRTQEQRRDAVEGSGGKHAVLVATDIARGPISTVSTR